MEEGSGFAFSCPVSSVRHAESGFHPSFRSTAVLAWLKKLGDREIFWAMIGLFGLLVLGLNWNG